jgi:hypothetical protein
MRPSLSRPLLALFAGLVLLSTGCIDFEKQTIVVAFNPDRDEANVLLVYEDMNPGGDKEDDLKNARETLDLFFAQGKGFELAHPWAMIHLTPPEEKKNPTEFDKKMVPHLIKHLTVKKGTVFVNKDGRLCGTQTITVRGAKKFVEGLNDYISENVGESAEKKLADRTKRGGEDEETLRLWQKAAQDKHAWFSFEPGQVKLTLVGSSKYLAEMKRDLAKDLFLRQLRQALAPRPEKDAPPGAPPKAPTAEQLAKNRHQLREMERWGELIATVPWSVEQKRDRLSLAIGLPDGGPLRLFSPYATEKPGMKAEEMIAHAKKLGLTFQKDATVESVIADFLRKHPPAKPK